MNIVTAAIALALSTPAFAEPCPPLRVRNPDGNYIVPGVQGDILYSGDRALDAYVQQGSRRRPVVVVIHGGTWSSGSRVAHVGQILDVLTQAGYAWFSVDYRLGGLPRFEESLADIRTALAFIRCRARELGIDPNRMVLLGEDSGAHLTALLAAERLRGVIGAVLVGGFYDLTTTPGVSTDVDGALVARASPVTHVAPAMPPVLVVHGSADSEAPIDQARRYCAAVVRSNGRCRLLEVEGASHRSENWWPSQWGYKRDIVAWLSALDSPPALLGGPHRPHPTTISGTLQKDIVYSTSPHLKLDAFLPPAPSDVEGPAPSGVEGRARTPGPAVILVHGGGWEAGDKTTYITPLFEPLARAGLAWFSIDYRLTPAAAHQDQIADVRQAIRFVRDEHARFNIDPARIVLVGESASGQIVTQIATEDSSLAGVISFYGVYDMLSMVTDASPRSLLVRLFRRTVLDDDSRALLRQYSPLYQAHKGMPPLLLVNGTGDRLWPQAQAFALRLTDLGVRHDVIALEGAPHGLENWEGHAEWTTYKQRVVEWIRRVVSFPSTSSDK
jgi:acetyl esterase